MPEVGRIVLMYGPPAVGKDTVTTELVCLDSRYSLFPRIKCGPGRESGYRMVSASELADIREKKDEIIWENNRYGATYITDKGYLVKMLDEGKVPVLHLGQPEAIDAVRAGIPAAASFVVELTYPREIAIRRINSRGTGDTDARIEAYDKTPRLAHADVSIDTNEVSAQAAALTIDRELRCHR